MIRVQNLVRRFGSFTALDGLTFEVEKGEVVGFLGVNGAGKTTTMRILSGFLPATKGSVHVAGFDVLRQSLEVRRRIGYLPESVPLYREHRIEEMLRFQGRLHGLSAKETRARIPAVLERVDLTDRARTPIGQLSKGLRQRAGIAVALLPDPEVLILDEPTSGLDPLQRVEVRRLLKDLASEHTVLLSSHILPEVEAVAPRMIIVHGGRIAAQGTREELVRSLGSPSHVRFEAVVGPAAEDARRLLRAIPGAAEVRDRGRLGIHQVFEIETEEDLREDVGALAAAKGWAVRELSWHAPTLEELFSRVALELDDAPPSAAPPAPAAAGGPAELSIAGAPGPAAGPQQAPGLGSVGLPVAPPGGDEGPKRKVYNLNPFDQGGGRDLGKPKEVDGP